jgi:succinoglycan biosynthesis protein ExoA
VSVSAVMAVRDEPFERVARAVGSLAAQHHSGPVELLIAAPPDQHARLARLRPTGAVHRVVLVANPCGERSPGLNRAVGMATAPFVVRIDARSLLPADYVSRCVQRLVDDPAVGVVGGVQRPRARADEARAGGIARALRNPWVLGAARYRRPGSRGPADTVYLGVFRRDELLATRYDPQLAANEDFDVCTRYRRAGQQVWIEESLEVDYEARDTYADLWRQYRAFGAAKVRFWRRTRARPQLRQVIALGGVGAAAVLVARQGRHPRRLVALAAIAAGGLALVDHVAEPREPRVRVRAHSVVASVCIVGAWVSGVAQEALRAPIR